MASFDMPEFYLPFTARSNPRVAATREHSKAWAIEMGMLADPAAEITVWTTEEYDATDIARFAALTSPSVPGPQLDLYCDWFVWGFYFDDFFVKAFKLNRDYAGAKAMMDRLPLFTPLYGTVIPVPVNPVERGLADVWARSVPGLPPDERRQLARGAHVMVRSWLWELHNLVHDRIPDPIDYVEMRRQTGGLEYLVNTTRLALGVRLDPTLLRTRQFRRLADAVGDVNCLFNDIVSYRRETEYEHEVHNGVEVARRFLDCDLSHAVGVMNDIVTSRMHQMKDIIESDLPALFDTLDLADEARSAAHTYTAALQDWTAGHYQWSLGTGRFGAPHLWAPMPDGRRTTAQVSGPIGLGAATLRIASLAPVSRPTAKPARTEERHRAIVIGSGFGGAVAAYRLAEVGVRTVVLERGRRWPVAEDGSTFPSFFAPDRRSSWFTPGPVCDGQPPVVYQPYAGLFERVHGAGIDVLCGAGVGGGSLVYGGVMLRPTERHFAASIPPIVDYSEMAGRYYPTVERMIGVAPIPEDVLAHENYHSTRLFMERARRAGFRCEPVNQACDWDVVRAELRGQAPAAASVGEHLSGVNSGARQSLDRNYLRLAEESGKVTVHPLHVVSAIGVDRQGRYRVEVDHIDTDGNILEQKVLTGDALFLGAGSTGTAKLLVKARETGSLPRLNEHVGRHWGNNGLRSYWLTTPSEETGTYQGGPACIQMCDWENAHGPVTIEHQGFPIPAETHLLYTPGISICRPLGTFGYSPVDDDVHLRWPAVADMVARRAILSTVHRLSFAGARPAAVGGPTTGHATQDAPIRRAGGIVDFTTGTESGLFDQTALSPSTAHPLGGAVLTKACDGYGRVRGYRGLYVMDGALIPGNTGACNPALTIAALAERCMDDIVRKDVGAVF